jgi:hypothetical protein
MFQFKIFVRKLFTINTFPSGSVEVGEITTLTHKTWNHTMKDASFVTKSFFTSTKGPEVFGCLRDDIRTQFECNATSILVCNLNIKKDFRRRMMSQIYFMAFNQQLMILIFMLKRERNTYDKHTLTNLLDLPC